MNLFCCKRPQQSCSIEAEDEEFLLEPKSQPTRSFYHRLKGWTTQLTGKIAATGTLGVAVYYNIVRDLTWAQLTYQYYNLEFKTADTWHEANGSQWLYSTAAMCVAILPHYLACQASKQKMPWSTAFVNIITASLAIPGWNIAAKLGNSWGKSLGMSPTAAGYFSGLFTGLAEGPIQEAVTSLGQYITAPEEKAKYAANPGQYFIQFLKRFLFSATFGAIPGDVWQFIYNAGKTNEIGSIPTGLTIASGVAFCNIMYDKFKNAALLEPTIQDSYPYPLINVRH